MVTVGVVRRRVGSWNALAKPGSTVVYSSGAAINPARAALLVSALRYSYKAQWKVKYLRYSR